MVTMETAKVYRVGSLRPPASYPKSLRESTDFVDSFCPDGRQRRSGALFASLSLSSSGRWIQHMRLIRLGVYDAIHELTVDSSRCYHYSISAWANAEYEWEEQHRSPGDPGVASRDYWESGLLLSDPWDESLDREVLVDPSSVLSVRRVANAEAFLALYGDEEDLERLRKQADHGYLAQLQHGLDSRFSEVYPPILI